MTLRDRDGDPIPDVLMPTGWRQLYRRPRVVRALARQFNRVYYANIERTVFDCSWLGTTVLKYPTDMWSYQEIISQQRPQLIIETGSWKGGSALFFATVCEQLGEGRVLSIDIKDHGQFAVEHPRVTFHLGSSTAPETLDMVREAAARAERVLVILDSDHSRDHVLAELHAYAPFVHVGGHMIAEDTNVNDHPVLPEFGPGPYEAVEAFLATDPGFVRDDYRERALLTANPGGFLRRTR